MESIPLLYQIISIIVINTIVVSIIAYFLCKSKVRREIKTLLSQTKLNEAGKVKQKSSELQKNETEVFKQYQGSTSKVESKDVASEKQAKDKKKQKYLRYTTTGYINIEEDKDKKKSKWR
jgi:hypothetical protein